MKDSAADSLCETEARLTPINDNVALRNIVKNFSADSDPENVSVPERLCPT